MVFGEKLAPVSRSFVVAFQTFGWRTFENGYIQIFFLNLKNVHKIFVSPANGFLLEIITKAPIAKHLEHCVMISVMSHLFKVVVLTAYAQAFLRIRAAAALGLHISQNNVLKLIHARVGEHKRGIVLNHNGSGRHYKMSF